MNATIVLLVVLLLSISACAAHYSMHPGALNRTDSAAYDTLLIAETAIDQARLHLKAGQLPEPAQAALNALIHTYNTARESWLTYRGAISTQVAPDEYLSRLNQNLTDLTTAIRSFQSAQEAK